MEDTRFEPAASSAASAAPALVEVAEADDWSKDLDDAPPAALAAPADEASTSQPTASQGRFQDDLLNEFSL